jgi:hypothetical protein
MQLRGDEVEQFLESISNIAVHLKYLGNGNAASEMGAIEHLGVCFLEGMKTVAEAIDGLADAIREQKEEQS